MEVWRGSQSDGRKIESERGKGERVKRGRGGREGKGCGDSERKMKSRFCVKSG